MFFRSWFESAFQDDPHAMVSNSKRYEAYWYLFYWNKTEGAWRKYQSQKPETPALGQVTDAINDACRKDVDILSLVGVKFVEGRPFPEMANAFLTLPIHTVFNLQMKGINLGRSTAYQEVMLNYKGSNVVKYRYKIPKYGEKFVRDVKVSTNVDVTYQLHPEEFMDIIAGS